PRGKSQRGDQQEIAAKTRRPAISGGDAVCREQSVPLLLLVALVPQAHRRSGQSAEKPRSEGAMEVEGESGVERPEPGGDSSRSGRERRPLQRRAGERAKLRSGKPDGRVDIG